MKSTVNTKKVNFNPYLKGFYDNPYLHYRDLREENPVHFSFMGVWILSKYKDIIEVYKHPDAFSSDIRTWRNYQKRYQNKSFIAWWLNHSVLNLDPPIHTSLRSYLKKSFMPDTVKSLNEQIVKIIDEKTNTIKQHHLPTFDFITEYALAVPLAVINYIFDIPEDDQQQVKAWSLDVSNLINPLPDLQALKAADQSIMAFSDYLKKLINNRAGSNKGYFLDKIMSTPVKELIKTDGYILSNLILMFVAGHETTVNLIGNGMFALFKHPEQYALLRKNPDLLPQAVEEMLRYDSPQQLSWRTAIEDIEIGGRVFKKGDQVLLLLGSANRDPEVFERPDVFDITKKPANHLSFGKGRHNCIGSWMARMQGKCAFSALLEQFERLHLEEEYEWLHNFSFRGLKKMKVRVQ